MKLVIQMLFPIKHVFLFYLYAIAIYHWVSCGQFFALCAFVGEKSHGEHKATQSKNRIDALCAFVGETTKSFVLFVPLRGNNY
jgi:hypothetical protein